MILVAVDGWWIFYIHRRHGNLNLHILFRSHYALFRIHPQNTCLCRPLRNGEYTCLFVNGARLGHLLNSDWRGPTVAENNTPAVLLYCEPWRSQRGPARTRYGQLCSFLRGRMAAFNSTWRGQVHLPLVRRRGKFVTVLVGSILQQHAFGRNSRPWPTVVLKNVQNRTRYSVARCALRVAFPHGPCSCFHTSLIFQMHLFYGHMLFSHPVVNTPQVEHAPSGTRPGERKICCVFFGRLQSRQEGDH